MDTDLTGKVALVTGGGSGIGAATCRTLARAGAAVAVVDHRSKSAQAVADAIVADGGKAIAIAADVRGEEAMHAAVSRTVEMRGGLQIVERTHRRNLEAASYDVQQSAKFPPLGRRAGDPAEVADLVLYLVSDASRYITGTEVAIDTGGTLLRG